MEIKHYNAIAKIIGGSLISDAKLQALINSLTQYFQSEDVNFNKDQFRSACLNGYYMEELDNVIDSYHETEIMPTKVEQGPYTWKPIKNSSSNADKGYKKALGRMTDTVIRALGNDNKVKR